MSAPVVDIATLRYLTVDEAATYLRLTTKALRRRIEIASIPSWTYTRVGRSIRFMRVALDQWLEYEAALGVGKQLLASVHGNNLRRVR